MGLGVSRDGAVFNRETGKTVGFVEKIRYPHSKDGEVTTKEVWEARKPHELAVESDFSFPTFDTRKKAVEYLEKF